MTRFLAGLLLMLAVPVWALSAPQVSVHRVKAKVKARGSVGKPAKPTPPLPPLPQQVPFHDAFIEICADKALSRAAQTKQESGFNPRAVSWVGAKGLLQAMPKTWVWYQDMRWVTRGADPFDPTQAIMGGHRFDLWLETRWAARLHTWQGVEAATWASFNAGEGSILKARWLADQLGLPGEDAWAITLPKVTGVENTKQTTDYVKRIRANREVLRPFFPEVSDGH